MVKTDTKVAPDWTVNDVMRCVPSSIGVLNGFGIDTCCGASDTLTVAAENARVSLDQLVHELNLCIRIYEPLEVEDAAVLAGRVAAPSMNRAKAV